MARMTGYKFLAETLKAYGVTHIFHVPTAFFGTMAALDGSSIQRVLTHGEKAAAYMADGYARASRRPGICMAQSIGAANMAAGMADAYMACSPVIAMTGGLRPLHRYRYAYQEFEHTQPFDAVTKASYQVDKVERLPDLIRQAFRDATSGSPGPVHLDIQDEALAAEADLEVLVEEQFMRIPSFRPEPEPARVQEAAALLMQAQKPVIVAGGGVIAAQAGDELRELAEMLTVPVATSLSGKSSIANNHPLWVGIVGQYSHWCANRIVSGADLVLFIGTRAGGMTTWNWKFPPRDMPTIQINIDPSDLGRNYPARVALLGDAKVTLQRLIEALEPLEPKTERLAEVQRLVAEWKAEFAPMRESNASPIRPERLCQEITESLPPDCLVVSDTGHSAIWSGTMIELSHPGMDYIRCAGSLGWGLPGAIGAQCASADRQVVCFTGDGGFWYHIAELETAIRHGISPVIVVNDNRSLNQEMRPIREAYGEPLWGNYRELLMFNDVDLAKVAQAMGCYGERVERPEEIRGALDRAFGADRLAVIDVVSDIEAMAPTPREADVKTSVGVPYR